MKEFVEKVKKNPEGIEVLIAQPNRFTNNGDATNNNRNFKRSVEPLISNSHSPFRNSSKKENKVPQRSKTVLPHQS